jgi:hypothetical protein
MRCDAMRCDATRRDATRCDACSRNHLSIAATTCTSSHERSTRSSAAYLDVQVCTTLHLACRSDAATYDTPHLYDVCHIRLSCMLTRAHGFILHVVRCTSYSVHVAPRRLARAHVAWCLHSAHKGRRLGLSHPVVLWLGLGHRSVSAHAIASSRASCACAPWRMRYARVSVACSMACRRLHFIVYRRNHATSTMQRA